MADVVTQVAVEALIGLNPGARVTQLAPEVLFKLSPPGRTTQVAVEVFAPLLGNVSFQGVRFGQGDPHSTGSTTLLPATSMYLRMNEDE